MNKINSLQSKILKTLYKSNGNLDAFTLFKRVKVSFSEYSQAINLLTELELIDRNEFRLHLTKTGREEILVHLRAIGLPNKHWRLIPTRILGQQIPIDEPYIPSISLLDKKTFNIS